MRSLRILLIEDSPDDEALLRLELKRAGIEVTFRRVETAAAMRAALESERWDLVLSDYHLPTFSAPEALAVVAAVAPEVPLVVMSGSGDEQKIASALEAGARDYVVKGERARLLAAIERHARGA
jgi:DNA-binding NtrC family response regulator